MATILVPSRIGTGFGQGLSEFLKILQKVRLLPPHEEIEFDMTGCHFLTPSFLLPMVLLIKKEAQSREVFCNSKLIPSLARYAELISFPNALRPENIMGGDYETYLDKYISKTFIPIIDFPVRRSEVETNIRDTFLGVVNSFLKKQLNLSGGILTAMYYLIDEAINNIVDHSTVERGFVFAQYYPSRKYVDFCIADSGIGILETYKRRPRNEILTDRDAIMNASVGISTKYLPAAESRGFGISTSKKMLADGLGGKYMLISGNALLARANGDESIIEIPEMLRWDGTIVVLRIPYTAPPTFNPALYYEN